MLLLLDIRTQARLSVEDVHELLRTSGQFDGQLPARSTLYRKLSGVGLKNERRLIEAIVRVCIPDAQRANMLREQAISLLHQAWSEDAEPDQPEPGVVPDDGGSLAELVRVQRELIDTQAQLTAALQTATEAEKESAKSRALVTTLLVLGALGRPAAGRVSAPSPDGPSYAVSGIELSRLRTRLAAAEAERDEAQQVARAAQHRLAEAENLLTAHGTGSTDPTGLSAPAATGPVEWPTTRTDPAGQAAPADTLRSSRQALPDTTGTAIEREVEQGEVSSFEGHKRVRSLEQDPELAEVLAEMLRLDPDGSRMGSVIDGAGRHLLDPAHTGRYLWSQLTKVEKTGLGTAVYHRMQRELGLADGLHLDFMVAGHDVDMKFTRGSNWMFPPELQGGLCLVVRADDASGLWSIGLLRVRSELMNTGSNRDGKRTLSAQGREAIHWIHSNLPLPEHALRRLSADTVSSIFAKASGQARTEELFLQAQLTPITTADLSAVTMQADGVKRAREARQRLAHRGVLVLNGTRPRDVEWAWGLGLPALEPSTWMSVRLTPAQPGHEGTPTIMLDGTPWCVAHPEDLEGPLPTAAFA
ncbi:NaeI family type II restriction endonuclease [Streptomyces nigra]|uniref:NaeI family type II restriction endonuclease n=1 Tax=Streptomyces nigra TaxID=1827580 RepID=UPI0036624F34